MSGPSDEDEDLQGHGESTRSVSEDRPDSACHPDAAGAHQRAKAQCVEHLTLAEPVSFPMYVESAAYIQLDFARYMHSKHRVVPRAIRLRSGVRVRP